jgi:hypothetical protein
LRRSSSVSRDWRVHHQRSSPSHRWLLTSRSLVCLPRGFVCLTKSPMAGSTATPSCTLSGYYGVWSIIHPSLLEVLLEVLFDYPTPHIWR